MPITDATNAFRRRTVAFLVDGWYSIGRRFEKLVMLDQRYVPHIGKRVILRVDVIRKSVNRNIYQMHKVFAMAKTAFSLVVRILDAPGPGNLSG